MHLSRMMSRPLALPTVHPWLFTPICEPCKHRLEVSYQLPNSGTSFVITACSIPAPMQLECSSEESKCRFMPPHFLPHRFLFHNSGEAAKYISNSHLHCVCDLELNDYTQGQGWWGCGLLEKTICRTSGRFSGVVPLEGTRAKLLANLNNAIVLGK